MSKQQQQFKFTGYNILKSLIEIKDFNDTNKELNVKFERSAGIKGANNKFKLDMHLTINNSNNSVMIDIVACGYFEFDNELDNETENIFFNTSAPAILFPYIRAYISTLTSLSGINPITLPTLNLTGGAVNE